MTTPPSTLFQWVLQQPSFNSTGANQFPSIACDREENFLITYCENGGSISGVSFDPAINGSIVVFKFNRYGDILWVQRYGTIGSPDNTVSVIAVDSDNNPHVSWTTQGYASGQSNVGSFDVVLMKLDSNGNIFWMVQNPIFDTLLFDGVTSISIDSQNHAYIAYRSNGTVSGESYDADARIVITKFDIDGNVLWVHQRQPILGNDDPMIYVDSDDNVWVAYWSDTAVSGQTVVGETDIVVSKIDPDGNVLWIREQPSFNTSGTDIYPWMAPDHLGNMFISYRLYYGSFSDQQIVIFKMDGSGNVLWRQEYPELFANINDYATAIATDSKDNVYAVFRYYDDVINGDVLSIGKLNTDGDLMWVARDPLMSPPPGTTIQLPRIAVDSDDYLYITYFADDAVPGQTLTGNPDIVIVKALPYIECLNPQITIDNSDNIYYVYHSNSMNYNNSNLGFYDIVVVKKDNTGQTLWVKQDPIFNTNDIDKNPSIVTYGNYIYVVYQTVTSVSGGDFCYPYDIVVLKLDNTGGIVWVKQQLIFNTTRSDESPSIDVDASGNLYIAYQTTGLVSGGYRTADFDHNDLVVLRLDPDGNLIWIQQNNQFNSQIGSYGPRIKCDSVNSCLYVAYVTEGAISGQAFSGYTDIAVLKMDLDGNFVWVQQSPTFNTEMSDDYVTMCLDQFGNIYLCYASEGSASGQSNSGETDLVICKLDPSGLLWKIKQVPIFNTTVADTHPSMCYRFGHLYIAYQTTGTVSGQTSCGEFDLVVMKLSAVTLNVVWIHQNASFNTTMDETNPSIAVDSNGSVFTAYETSGNLDSSTPNLETSVVICKLFNSGVFDWVKRI